MSKFLSHHTYQTLFRDHPYREGAIVDPISILSMRIKRGEMPCSELLFESNLKINQSYDEWIMEVLAKPQISKMMPNVGIKEALNFSRLISINRRRNDLEFLISRWSMESYTFLATGGGGGGDLVQLSRMWQF